MNRNKRAISTIDLLNFKFFFYFFFKLQFNIKMKVPGPGVREVWDHMPALPLISSVILDNSLTFSQPQFPHLHQKNDKRAQFIGVP